jgi:hypothetical protein
MAERKRSRQVVLGVQCDVVPLKDLSRIPPEVLNGAWELCGPAAEMNMRNHCLRKVISAAYVEGLMHGAGITEEKYAHGTTEACVRDRDAVQTNNAASKTNDWRD